MSARPLVRWIVAAAALVTAATLAVGAPLAAPSPLKLGTLAPASSSWYTQLNSMGAAWAKSTDGRVTLRVFPVDSDAEAIDRMSDRVNDLQAATLFVAGLGQIDEAFNVFGIPFFFESDAEFEHVQKALGPMLGQRLAAKKYRLLNWSNGGWVRLFSKQPLRSIADIQAAKLYTSAGDARTVEWYRRAGFNAVPLQTTQIVGNLSNAIGLINATPMPPAYAVVTRVFDPAPYMLDLRLGPFMAATVMTERAWSRISAEDQIKVQAAAEEMAKRVNSGAPVLDEKSITAMKGAKLQVVTLDARQLAEFKTRAEEIGRTQRGVLVPVDVFDAAVRIRDEYRKARR